VATKANPANQFAPAHDIRHMAGINVKKLLPPVRTQAEASDLVLLGERKRKRKGPSKGEFSRLETLATLEVLMAEASLAGVDTLPSVDETDVEMVGPFVPDVDTGGKFL
jgi:hypothetical protein